MNNHPTSIEVPWRKIFYIWLIFSSLKLLLFHAYKSTDFEVHRNWMAITYELPLKEWYFEKTSIWTLDYPPFFAYFEWLLARPAALFDREMVRVQNLDYSEKSVIIYQRATVIMSDLLFVYGCLRYFQAEAAQMKGKFDLLRYMFNYGSVALLILDSVHFQYNSMMYGLMILAIAFIKEKSYFKSALVYAILLNFKHIYLYFAPCFGLLYLKKVVFNQPSIAKGLKNFVILGFQTILIFGISFGPFIYAGGMGQLQQIASRLFPFQRGIVHSYWAANAWAAYVFYHKYVVNIYQGIMTGKSISCVYEVDKETDLETAKGWCLLATLAFLLPLIVRMCRSLSIRNFNFYLAATNFIAFNFGFHVHEKAILMTIIPLMLDAHKDSPISAKVRLVILKTIAVWTLLPLLINPMETLTKHLIFAIDIFTTQQIVLQLEISRDVKSLPQRFLLYLMFALIMLLQTWQVFFVDLYKQQHSGWMHRYQDFLPAIATVFNQIVFAEMLYRGLFKPQKIEGSWDKQQKNNQKIKNAAKLE